MALSVSIEFVSSSARVTSVKFAKGVFVSEFETTGPIDRTPGTPGSDKNKDQLVKMIFVALAAFHTYPS